MAIFFFWTVGCHASKDCRLASKTVASARTIIMTGSKNQSGGFAIAGNCLMNSPMEKKVQTAVIDQASKMS
jgi:hypothetical protein